MSAVLIAVLVSLLVASTHSQYARRRPSIAESGLAMLLNVYHVFQDKMSAVLIAVLVSLLIASTHSQYARRRPSIAESGLAMLLNVYHVFQDKMSAVLIAVLVSLLIASTHSQYARRRPSIAESGLAMLLNGVRGDMEEPRDERTILKEYDFIIVGAGTAGCTLANRLTEVDKWKVLLIEAGSTENFIMDIPIVANFLQFTQANWAYKTVPSNAACLGLKNRQCNYPRGKVMGGSSVLNYMIYTRGNRRDYDNWEKLGNTGWGYKHVLKYFMKSEDMSEPQLASDVRNHKTGGYLTVGYPPYRTPLADAFLEAGVETGQRVVDYNGDTQTGFSLLQTTMRNGTRWSASRAFLRPIRNRKNLHVKKQAMVTRILIDAATRRAYGVEFERGHRKYLVRARKEVIVSAGAINSPQLLMVSGIGPKKHLRHMKIPVIQPLQVGYNLQDHIAFGGLVFIVNQSVSLRTEELLGDRQNYVDYLAYHRGPWSVPGGCEALAFYDMKHPNDTDGYPDMELLFEGGSIVSEPTFRIGFGIDDDLYAAVYKPAENSHSWMVLPMLMLPKSRGRIMLRNNNPRAKPLIYHNYFSDPEDLTTLVAGAKIAINLSKTNAFQKFGSRLHDIPIPGCAGSEFGSDEYLGCMARHLTFTIYHQSGTCKMGPASDKEAVVDPRLRVYGIKGLRVIDASIIPVIPAAHTNAPVYMIAEKGADMIKQDWGEMPKN